MNQKAIMVAAIAVVALGLAATIVFLTSGSKEAAVEPSIAAADAGDAAGGDPASPPATDLPQVATAQEEPTLLPGLEAASVELPDGEILPTVQDFDSPVPDPNGENVDLAYGAYQRGLYREAFAQALPLAEDGNVASQTLLGILYSEGWAVPQNFEEAAGWFELAAEAGDAAAQLELGLFYLDGLGVEEDPARAVELFQRAADQGVPEAIYNVGLAYIEGAVLEQDLTLAADYISRAAGEGLTMAEYALAQLYMSGQGVLLSDEIANRWLARAAEGGLVDAQIEYAIRLFQGTGTEPDEAAAAAWFRQAALAGNAVGHARYGLLLAYGAGVEPDAVEAGKHYLLARLGGLDDPMLRDFYETLDDDQQAAATRAAEIEALGIPGG